MAKQVPQDRLLIETDAPYLAPVPFRGKTNEPAFVKHVAECLATLRATCFRGYRRANDAKFLRAFPARKSS